MGARTEATLAPHAATAAHRQPLTEPRRRRRPSPADGRSATQRPTQRCTALFARGKREAAEAEVSAAALRVLWAMCLAYDAACLPFGMVGELRRKLSPIALAVLLLFMGVGMMNIRVSESFRACASVLHSAESDSESAG